jgi:hypothetical protein
MGFKRLAIERAGRVGSGRLGFMILSLPQDLGFISVINSTECRFRRNNRAHLGIATRQRRASCLP